MTRSRLQRYKHSTSPIKSIRLVRIRLGSTKKRIKVETFKNQFQRATFVFITILILLGVYTKVSYDIIHDMTAQAKLISPVPSPTPTPITQYVKVKEEDIDTWVRDSITQFFPSEYQRSEMKMIMHCLLNRESKHGLDDGHGDGGKAGGPLQYWEDTWIGYRNEMIKSGLATEISTRYNVKDAINTTVWAIKNGRGYAWGPILRDSKNNHNNSCPVPSWY